MIFASVAAGLCLVLAALLVLVRLTAGAGLRPRNRVPDPSLEVRVLSRTTLAHKQGLAVVQIGERRLAVSYGEGGVRVLLESEGPGLAPADTVERSSRTIGGTLGTVSTIPVLPPASYGEPDACSRTDALGAWAAPFVDRLRIFMKRGAA